MEVVSEPVQTEQKKRSREAKIGRIKYTLELLKQVQKNIEEIKLSQRTIFAGLKGMFNFQKSFIEKIAFSDEIDQEILDLLHEAGGVGMLPKDLAARLTTYKIRRHQVSRRIIRMNKRLEKEIGERLVEKRGWHWALTSFGYEVWGKTEQDATQLT